MEFSLAIRATNARCRHEVSSGNAFGRPRPERIPPSDVRRGGHGRLWCGEDRDRQAVGRSPSVDLPRRRRFSFARERREDEGRSAARWPWLDALARELRDAVAGRGNFVLACSALTRRYRDRLGLPHSSIRLVHLDDASDVIRRRMEQRTAHFMPIALLDSQLKLLERPGADERPIVVDVAGNPDSIVDAILAALE